jgi:triosephosphate isomerase
LIDDMLSAGITLQPHQQVIFAVPYPYLPMANSRLAMENNFAASAQNCYHKSSGAYTGEVSADMLYSIGVHYCIVGHSERREYFKETNHEIAEKINQLLIEKITPIFCCGESLEIRNQGSQNTYVETQLRESLFHLSPEQLMGICIAYEPVWAIGTGKTATTEEAQEMHAYLRSVIAAQYGEEMASAISILYGGSVKPSNAKEIFAAADVDGGLVGGASLMAQDFIQIVKALK